MKHLFITALLLSAFSAFSQTYPATKKNLQTLSKHGLSYQDDYSWLEKMGSPEVENWVDAQNRLTNSHLSGISSSVYPLPAIQKYEDKTNYHMPQKNGTYFYSLMRYSEEEKQTPVLAYKKDIDGEFVELINPNFFYKGKTVNVTDYSPSKTSKTLAYKIMINGSDQQEVCFVTLPGGKKYPEVIKNVKFSDVAWKGDEGIFYNKNENKSQFSADSTYQVYYHKIGTPVNNDIQIFDGTKNKNQFDYFTSESGDKFFLTVVDKEEKSGSLYYANLTKAEFKLITVIENYPLDFLILGYDNEKIFISTGEANWGDIRYFTLENPQEIKIVVPQYQNQLLIESHFYKNRIVCKYKNLDGAYLMIFDYNGKVIKKIQTPKAMDVNITGKDYYAKDLFFNVSSYTVPSILFTLNIESGDYKRYVTNTHTKTTAQFPLDYFTTKATTYLTRDGQQVPITIVYKKDMVLNGNNPTLLEAYGGFGTISSPDYDNGLLYFLNNGGVYAYAEIRGGGDKGLAWHRAGKRLKKINTMNDFIDAAKYLIEEKYTSAGRLAITGGSQGGLLVGAAMVNSPELFKVAIPKVGVYDMAKFDQYTVGRYHQDEYGNPEAKDEFEAMMVYSPYHNIKEDVNYPTTLIITSDNDDRVPPVHSYKFAARLQSRAAQVNPVYLKTIRNAGHYGTMTNPDEILQEKSEFYSFLLYHLKK